jgi:ribose/xylose/arabinose/galactoside ABC-type transport system permease subunit
MSETTELAAKQSGRRWARGLARWMGGSREILSILIALVILGAFFSIVSPYFLTVKNILNFTMNMSILGLMAAGLFIAMVIGEIDVSQYAVLAMSTAVMVILIRRGMPVGPAVAICIAVSLVSGVINGVSVAFLRINPIIATLATMMVYRGIAFKLTEAKALGVSGAFFTAIGSSRLWGIPVSVFILVGVYAIVHVVLSYTAYGKRVYAVGGNAQAAYISGINVKMVRFWGLVISSLAAGIAGLIFVGQVGATVPTAGEGGLMDVVTAVILGGISLSGGKGRITGTLIGVLVLAILSNGMVLMSVQGYYQTIVKGIVIFLAVFVDTLRGGGFK